MFRAITYTLITVALLAFTPAPAQAQSVLTVVIIDTNGNTAEYLKRLKSTLDLAKSMASDVRWRVWEGTYAGATTGRIIVTAEYASQTALAEADAAAAASKEFAATIVALREMGSVVVSRSMLTDVMPE